MSSSELAPDVPEEDGARALSGVRRHVGATLSKRWFRVALCVLGVATAPLIVFEAVRSGGLDALDTTAVLWVLAPWSFVVSGFIAWDRRPENRVGALLMALGFLWTAGMLMQPPTTSSSLIYTIGIVWRLAWVSAFVFVLLSFPHGRLATLADKLVVATVFIVAVPLEIVWLLFLDSPINAFVVWPSESIEDAVDTAQRVIFVGATLVLVAVLAKRWFAASRPLRRTLAPVVAGGVTVLGFAVFVIVEKFHPVATYLWWDVFAAYTVVPVALLWSILRARLARSSVGDLFVELRANPAPEQLRGALARALGDPSLELAFWLPEYETYADLEGRPIDLPEDGGRATTLVERNGVPLAALVHDPSLREEPALLDSVCAAAGIALENAQLQSELRARLEELKGSRARILEAAQTERQRLERNLHDGAQQRLVSLSLELGMLGKRFGADSEAKQAVEQARRELNESLRELRELARGIHPAVVTDLGLEVALEGLRARAKLPVRLTVDLDARLPEPIEVAAYYVVCESLTNVTKYAHASAVTVDVSRSDDELVVEIVDDGLGGASTDGGSGLRGLADRVEALGGRLRVWSPQGGGTRIRAEIPCA